VHLLSQWCNVRIFGAVGTVTGNPGMTRYAETSLDAMWKILGVAFLPSFASLLHSPARATEH
jgi:hypothetical protein